MKIMHLENINISKQLEIEKDILQNSQNDYLILNHGSKETIVLGILNKEKDLIHLNNAQKDNISITRRFSAGGTVFVDNNTLFVTFILSQKTLDIDFFPEPIMRWSEKFYNKALKLDNFQLIENDFAINNKKIAGNAKYIKKDRFLLHTSFLWDFNIDKINKYLTLPQKAPIYRKQRSHKDFMSTINSYFKSKNEFFEKIKIEFQKNLL